MCRWLGVSRSGFYEWRGRPSSATERRRFWLAVQVAKTFKASRGTYGYRRVHAALAQRGIEAGPERGCQVLCVRDYPTDLSSCLL
jgi:putative transposase